MSPDTTTLGKLTNMAAVHWLSTLGWSGSRTGFEASVEWQQQRLDVYRS